MLCAETARTSSSTWDLLITVLSILTGDTPAQLASIAKHAQSKSKGLPPRQLHETDFEYKTFCELTAAHMQTLRQLRNKRVFTKNGWAAVQPAMKRIDAGCEGIHTWLGIQTTMKLSLTIICSIGASDMGGEHAHGMDVLSSAAASLAPAATASAIPKQARQLRKRTADAARSPSDDPIAKTRYADYLIQCCCNQDYAVRACHSFSIIVLGCAGRQSGLPARCPTLVIRQQTSRHCQLACYHLMQTARL